MEAVVVMVVVVVVVVVAVGVGALSVVVVVLTLNSQVQIDFFDNKKHVVFVMQYDVMKTVVGGVVVVVVANASFSMAFPLETHPSLISKGKTCI